MLWFYERDTIVLRLETRYDSAAAEYSGSASSSGRSTGVAAVPETGAVSSMAPGAGGDADRRPMDAEGIARHLARRLAREDTADVRIIRPTVDSPLGLYDFDFRVCVPFNGEGGN